MSEALSEPLTEASAPDGRAIPEEGTSSHRSELFTVRLWPEEIDGGEVEWRGEVRHVMSGQSRYFREWAALAAFLEEMLPDTCRT